MTQTSHDTFAACVGIDWADATHALCLQAAGTTTRECCQRAHTPEAIEAWVTTLRTRCSGHPIAVCLARTQGPLVSAVRTDDLLVLCPVNPLPLARYRDACTPSRATDDPTDAARQRARLRTPRDTLPPLQPQRPTRRALDPLVAHRRRVGGDKGRMTHRLTSTLKHYCPQVLQWCQDKDTRMFCDVLRRWPTRTAAPLARRSTLAACCRDHHVRSADVLAQRIHALQTALPWTTDAGVIAPHAVLVQPLVNQLRVTVEALKTCENAIAQCAQHPPDCPLFQARPGAGPVCAPRLRAACGAQRERSASAAARPK